MTIESGFVKRRTLLGHPVGHARPFGRDEMLVGRDPAREVSCQNSFWPLRKNPPIAVMCSGGRLVKENHNMVIEAAPDTVYVGSRLRPLTRLIGWAITSCAPPGVE
jgi:hypothetical protein